MIGKTNRKYSPLEKKIGSKAVIIMAKIRGRIRREIVSAKIRVFSSSESAFRSSTTAVWEVPKFTKIAANTE
jgi:hypothetical protein